MLITKTTFLIIILISIIGLEKLFPVKISWNLSDQSQGVFNGQVYIAPNASKSRSEQINKNLMLSKQAENNTKPELRIYNDNVKATHGATVGQLDKEQSFYLQSRGYTYQEALKTLSKAFVFDLIDGESSHVKDFYVSDLDQIIFNSGES